ncbi:MAG: hypothetical protein M1823_005472 [Watsoniomyces obsoletus]|nr:MAG: hypothetical protein M1823_005472 [Watsoniomyces obsoletus]
MSNKAEIIALAKAFNKAVAANEPAKALIDILERIKSAVKPTEELLRSTKVGIAINRQAKHANPEVAKLVNELVHKWKETITAEKANNARAVKPITNFKSGGINSPKVASPHKVENQNPKDKKGKPIVSSGLPQNDRTWETDGVDPNYTDDKLRNAITGMLYNALAHAGKEPSEFLLKRAKEIEAAICEHYKGNLETGGYRQKFRTLYSNIKNKSNKDLRKCVLSGEIAPERLVTMTHEELKSAKQREEDAKMMKLNMNKAMVAKGEKSVSTALTCGKCNQKQVSYTQAQTRSADEPMTTFCECQICGHHWKFS